MRNGYVKRRKCSIFPSRSINSLNVSTPAFANTFGDKQSKEKNLSEYNLSLAPQSLISQGGESVYVSDNVQGEPCDSNSAAHVDI